MPACRKEGNCEGIDFVQDLVETCYGTCVQVMIDSVGSTPMTPESRLKRLVDITHDLIDKNLNLSGSRLKQVKEGTQRTITCEDCQNSYVSNLESQTKQLIINFKPKPKDV